MKNLKIVIVSILMIMLLSILFIRNLNEQNKQTTESADAIKFKEEYESLNENNDKKYKEIKIPENNPMVYSTYEEIKELITNGTGVIYFGFPECPWCRNAVPVLIEASEEVGLDKIYYFNALEMRDIKSLDENGNIVTEKEGTKEYENLVEMLYDYLEVYDGLNDSTIKRLYFPTVVFIKDGEILGTHTSTVDSQTDPSVSLTDEQHEDLKGIYTSYMLNVLGTACDNNLENKC